MSAGEAPSSVGKTCVDENAVQDGALARSLLKTLCGIFGWARWLEAKFGPMRQHFDCSSAFSGIGCPELAASSLEGLERRCASAFISAAEYDPMWRRFLGLFYKHRWCADDLLEK